MSVVGGKLKLKGNVSIKSTSHKSGKDKKKDKKRDKKEKKEKKQKKEKKETPLDKVEVVEEKSKKRERDDLDDELSQMTPSERSYEIIQRERVCPLLSTFLSLCFSRSHLLLLLDLTI
jgi:hypothetical protein